MIDDDPLWYKDAVIYQLHVKAFFDSNGDGVGDFTGLTQRLDYIRDLGATAIWLLPFYPSPLRDDGYDISDYKNVNAAYGTMRDFRAFVRAAHDCGLRVISELVVNHTSDQHPWFQRARRARPESVWRDFYVWSDSDERYGGTRVIFPGKEVSNWAWDPVAKAYYWHRFFSHEPDLNYDNPRVLEAVTNVIRFWLDAGVDGIRLDAVPYLCERDGTANENLPETHAVLKRLREAIDREYRNRILLAEANLWPEDVAPYFGDGDECHMAFHFALMPRMFMGIAEEDRYAITDIVRQTPEIPDSCQWAIFLRNHDELTVEMATDSERDYLYRIYATDSRAPLNVGVHRRLAPLVENDRRKLELLNGLLMSMKGTPIIYYGDEIGMGDNLAVGDRDGVRTPMQWSLDRNGGFSHADYQRLYLPAIIDPIYGFTSVNVETQSRNASSLLNWMRRLIRVRQAHRAFGRGSMTFLRPGNRKILAYIREYEETAILCVANLAASSQACALDLSRFRGAVPVELIGRSAFPSIDDERYVLALPGHSFYWFLLDREASAPSWQESLPDRLPEWLTLPVSAGWGDLLKGRNRDLLESEILPSFLATRRWFAGKEAGIGAVTIRKAFPVGTVADGALIALLDVTPVHGGAPQHYALPLAVHYGEPAELGADASREVLARVRTHGRRGLLHDALIDGRLAPRLVEEMRHRSAFPSSEGRLEFIAGEALAGVVLAPEPEVRRLGGEQSNTSIAIGDRLLLKGYRRIQEGIHPEPEMLRFLTEVARFDGVPAYFGAAECHTPAADIATLFVLQELLQSQGDAWKLSLTYLQRFFAYCKTFWQAGEGSRDPLQQDHSTFLERARRVGVRTAEFHRALATPTGDPAFCPEPIEARDIELWTEAACAQAHAAVDALGRARHRLTESICLEADALLERRDELLAHLGQILPERIDAMKTRHHGDYHLGQVLVVGHDFCIVDLEGEPARPLGERRYKSTPLRDVAGMLRSIDYVARAALIGIADQPEDLARFTPLADTWEDGVTAAFLDGYQERIAGCPSFPAEAATARGIVEFFAIEKACYEILYELENRPTWLAIPLRGLLRLFSREQARQTPGLTRDAALRSD